MMMSSTSPGTLSAGAFNSTKTCVKRDEVLSHQLRVAPEGIRILMVQRFVSFVRIGDNLWLATVDPCFGSGRKETVVACAN